VGVNVVQASWEALVDSISYGLLRAENGVDGDGSPEDGSRKETP
jgi:hypothetical protein